MKMNGLKRLSIVGGFLLLHGILMAQNCIPTGINGAVVDIACPQTCTNLNFQIPHIKGTDDYTVVSAPYAPYPYVTAGGVELTSTYLDDRFSSVINLPFTFCFYGAMYNSCVVGSNGLISFDGSNAGLANSWSLTTVPNGTTPQPIPYAGGTQNDLGNTYYPRASIMGPYQDIYPLITGVPTRKIEYSIVGTAPCRKFVASFYAVPMYGGPCNNLLCTQQIVIHESTGLIDIFIGDKQVCQDWNEGLAILGIQDWNRTKAKTAPGKNCTVWNESNTGYRFIPSGPGSRYIKSDIYTLAGTYIATADTGTTVTGLLDLHFNNFCPPTGTAQYEIRTTFSSCSNPAVQLISYDTITVSRTNSLNATATPTNTDCGTPNGTIAVAIPAGRGTPPFTYTLDAGAPVVSAAGNYLYSNVSFGPHTITVADNSGICASVVNVTVGRNNSIQGTITTTTASCSNVYNGTIKVLASAGTGPYSFQLDGLPPVPGANPYTFTNVNGGSHQVIIYDVSGCQSQLINVVVPTGAGVNANVNAIASTCPEASNGSIVVNSSTGISPFTLVLDSGSPSVRTLPYTFTGLAPGNHSVQVIDQVGCSQVLTVNVAPGPAMTAANLVTATSCLGASDGTIKVTPAGGSGPYTFLLDGVSPVTGNSSYTFTGVGSGLHTIQVSDGAGCQTNIYSVTVPFGPVITTTVSKTNVLCNGGATGTITVATPAVGAGPYSYSLDGLNWQPGNSFTGLAAGTYSVFYRSANGCQNSMSVTITEPAPLTATATMIAARCNGEANGTITMNASGGTAPYQYSINGGANWQSNPVFNQPAGTYTILTRDVNNCISTKSVTVTEPAPLTAFSNNSDASCDGGNDGKIIVTAAGGNAGYRYSLDGVNYGLSNLFSVNPGNYTVWVKDNLGCITSFTTVVGLTVNLFLTPHGNVSICEGTSRQLQTNSNATIYAWSPHIGLNDTTLSNPTANPAVTTRYTLKAVLGRCTAYDTMIVQVNAAPIPDAGPDGDICYGQSYTLQGSGGAQYNWTPALYLSSTVGANPVSTPTVSTNYSLSVIDAIGCRSLITDEVRVVVKRTMRVTTNPFDTIAHPGDRFQLMATSPGNSYVWSPAGGLSNPTIQNPVVTVGSLGDDITYQVVATDANGCKGEGFVRIKVYEGPDIYVPTAFTPNRDGKNETFLPVPVGIKSYHYFRVFNRWGQLIFSTVQQNQGWDGTIAGKEQPAGVYVWMIEGITADNRVITKKGTVTLIR